MALRPVLRVRNRGEKGKEAGGGNGAWKDNDKVRVCGWRSWRGDRPGRVEEESYEKEEDKEEEDWA
jgi:hypothetical protein